MQGSHQAQFHVQKESIFRLFCERAGVGTHHDKIVVIVVRKAVVKVVKIGSSNKEKRVG